MPLGAMQKPSIVNSLFSSFETAGVFGLPPCLQSTADVYMIFYVLQALRIQSGRIGRILGCMPTADACPLFTVAGACVMFVETDPDGSRNPADGARGAKRGTGEPG